MELLPQSITFGIFPEDVPKFSLTIGRKGGVREWEPFDETRHIQVLLVQPDDGIDITNSQRRSMMQVIYAGLFTNPCANISFIGGASPWGLMILTEGNAQMTFQEAMQMQAVDIRKLWQRKQRRHSALRERLDVGRLRHSSLSASEPLPTKVKAAPVERQRHRARAERTPGGRVIHLPVFPRRRD